MTAAFILLSYSTRSYLPCTVCQCDAVQVNGAVLASLMLTLNVSVNFEHLIAGREQMAKWLGLRRFSQKPITLQIIDWV